MSKYPLFILAGLLIVTPTTGAPASPQSGEVHEIKMTAKKYQYDPNVVTVKQGEKVRLIITALDRKHGFKLDAYGINQVLEKGDPTIIEFTADKPGTFVFRCSVVCGWGHHRMKGKLIVVPAS